MTGICHRINRQLQEPVTLVAVNDYKKPIPNLNMPELLSLYYFIKEGETMPNKDGTGPVGRGPGTGAGRGKNAGSGCGQGAGKSGRNNGRGGKCRPAQGAGGSNPAPPATGKNAD